MKKTILITLLMLLSIVAGAHDFVVDGIYYEISGNEAIVTYKGTTSYNHNTYSGVVSIPESVTYNGTTYSVHCIGSSAFTSCRDLVGITIPNSITRISNSAFSNCSGLKTITIPNSVTFIGNNAFAWCENVEYLEIPNSITTINEGAFCWCTSLTSIEIPNSVKIIGKGAFGSLKGIKTIQIPSSVTEIGESAFAGCSNLESVLIPSSVTQMGNYVFANCKNLNSITVESGNQFYDSRDNCNAIIESNTNKLLIGCRNTIIPNTVTAIGEGAFSECGPLNNPNFVFPESLSIFDNSSFYSTYPTSICFLGEIDRIGTRAFHNYEFAGSLIHLAFYGNINNPIATNAFWHGWHYTSEGQRNIGKIIIGPNVDIIKGMNVKPGADIYTYNPNPPEADDKTFLSYNSTLHVPASALASYFTAPYWSNFENIVGDAIEPIAVNIDQDTLEMVVSDDHIPLSASITPANAAPNDINWRSTDTSIAVVYGDGSVRAVAVGECDIIGFCIDKQDTCHIIVKTDPVTITLDKHDVKIHTNEMVILIPSSSNNYLPELSVVTSDPTVAVARAVNDKIQVVGVNPGIATIIVGSVDGTAQPDSCIVTVYSDSIKGDVNGDGEVNIADINAVIDMILSGNSNANGDVNNDGEVNIADINAIIDMILNQ